jgi:hypothetical protein
MTQKYANVYQFKITLRGSKPPIWRRIQVPETYSFWDLHVAIQDAMGWLDYHLHSFRFAPGSDGVAIEIGLPEGDEYLQSVKVKMKKYFHQEKDKAMYVYDFGDWWEHEIVLEKILPRDAKLEYPICLAGEMVCPMEDCGGMRGYQHILEVLSDPNHAEYADTIDWMGYDFDPTDFDPLDVDFDDPRERQKMAGV